MSDSRGLIEYGADGRGVDTAQFLASTADIKHPIEPSVLGIAPTLPVRHLAAQGFAVGNSSGKTLPTQYPNPNL